MRWLDPITQRYPRIPSYIVYDEEGRKIYPVGIPAFNDADVFYEWSEDNLKEVDLGILKRADCLAEVARDINVPPENLEATVARWNALVERGADEDFNRPSESMRPIRTPPFYYAAAWPIVSNTQGGPVHDEHWRIVDAFGEPILGLYEAGELGGIWGHLYLGGGNLAECYIGGWTAARHAARLEPWR
jgi:succinate dehydrogenase/fumarate reductase flavoprotein subunit